eukprot:GFYU01002061.1.p1 GENE.GFYU01002061.1~~GFYU01002061.1.p1  ORF type:complete len:506 (+),score=167.10 GFYU01002061.1:180-1520(+)
MSLAGIPASVRFPLQYGDFSISLHRVWFGGWNVMITDPEAARVIFTKHETAEKFTTSETRWWTIIAKFFGTNLVNANGSVHRHQRRVMNPAFHFDHLKNLTSTFGDCGQTLCNRFAEAKKEPVDVHHLMQGLTLDALGKAAFGFDFEALTNEDAPYVKVYNELVKISFKPIRFLTFGLYDMLPLAENTRGRELLRQFDDLLYSVINKRKDAMKDPSYTGSGDLLDLMLTGEDEEGRLTEKELRDNMVIFFLAGHDTTAHSLSMVMYYLAMNPDVQDKCLEEIERVMGKKVRPEGPTYEEQKELVYLTQVVRETLRLSPPVLALPTRVLNAPLEVAGVKYPANTKFMVNIFMLHRHPQHWKDAEKFDPDRFSAENMKGRHPFAWVPFSASGRNCIGTNFSYLEQRVVLPQILQKFRVKLPKDAEPIEFRPGILNAPKNLRVVFEPRV